jgi:hypothetical protein
MTFFSFFFGSSVGSCAKASQSGMLLPYKLMRVGSALAVLGGHVQRGTEHRTRDGVARNTLEI